MIWTFASRVALLSGAHHGSTLSRTRGKKMVVETVVSSRNGGRNSSREVVGGDGS